MKEFKVISKYDGTLSLNEDEVKRMLINIMSETAGEYEKAYIGLVFEFIASCKIADDLAIENSTIVCVADDNFVIMTNEEIDTMQAEHYEKGFADGIYQEQISQMNM